MDLSAIHFIFLVLTAIILFLYGLDHFSREVHRIGETYFHSALARWTRNRFLGFGIGAGLTALIQSSSAVSVLAIALVNSGVLPFRNCVAVLLGANVGTTVTAQLVAFKMTEVGPFFIVGGFALSLLRIRWSILGKTVFYFGFIFFSLDLISKTLLPLRETKEVMEILSSSVLPIQALAAGAVVTMLVQSSSVTTGLAILLVQQRHIPIDTAIPLILGANIGTTATGLIASIRMDRVAQRSAYANLIFNVLGVAFFFPFLVPFTRFLESFASAPSHIVASGHLIFNVSMSLLFLVLMDPFVKFVQRLIPDAPKSNLGPSDP